MLIHLQKIDVSPLEQLDIVQKSGIKLFMARADQVCKLASGNKLFKLQPHMDQAKENNISHLISFGGAYSNHIHALALYGQQTGFNTTGIIRGDPHNEIIYRNNPTLSDAQKAGMQLKFVERNEYRKRYDGDYLAQLQNLYPDAMIIPEGGSSPLAVKGCQQLASQINQIQSSDIVCVPCGTGATLAGIACGLTENQQAIGYCVVRDDTINRRIQQLLAGNPPQIDNQYQNWSLQAADYGGYAKLDKQLLDFILKWLDKTGILLDPIYTAKMCQRLLEQIQAGEFFQGTSITLVHTGGLQGWRGMRDKVIKLVGRVQWERILKQLD